jgi:hypothetical protein
MRRALIAGLLLVAACPAAANALPPRPPSAVKTRAAIKHLKVAKPLSMRGYSRKWFPHWTSQGCDVGEAPRPVGRPGRGRLDERVSEC